MESMLDKDAFYFPHFSNARHDRKIRRVRKELGIEGYGIFFMILEILREQAEYRYPVEDIDLLADEIGTSEQKVRAVIANYSLFEIDENEMFFSSNLILFLQPYLQGKERKRISGIRGNLIRYKYITKEQSNEMSDESILLLNNKIKESSQCDRLAIPIKENKSKVNNNKLNEIKDIVDYLNSVLSSKYRSTTDSTQRHIRARLTDGFTVEDFYTVIDKKYREWHGDPKMDKFLRPETLFGTKFESYLNQPEIAEFKEPEKTKSIFDMTQEEKRAELERRYGKVEYDS